MTITDAIHQAVLKVPASAWTPAVEPDSDIRDGAWVAELAGGCLTGWPKGLDQRALSGLASPRQRVPAGSHAADRAVTTQPRLISSGPETRRSGVQGVV